MGVTTLTLLTALLWIHPASLPATPEEPVAHYSRADALAARGELDAAISEYQQTLSMKPDFAQAHKEIGRAHV